MLLPLLAGVFLPPPPHTLFEVERAHGLQGMTGISFLWVFLGGFFGVGLGRVWKGPALNACLCHTYRQTQGGMLGRSG